MTKPNTWPMVDKAIRYQDVLVFLFLAFLVAISGCQQLGLLRSPDSPRETLLTTVTWHATVTKQLNDLICAPPAPVTCQPVITKEQHLHALDDLDEALSFLRAASKIQEQGDYETARNAYGKATAILETVAAMTYQWTELR